MWATCATPYSLFAFAFQCLPLLYIASRLHFEMSFWSYFSFPITFTYYLNKYCSESGPLPNRCITSLGQLQQLVLMSALAAAAATASPFLPRLRPCTTVGFLACCSPRRPCTTVARVG